VIRWNYFKTKSIEKTSIATIHANVSKIFDERIISTIFLRNIYKVPLHSFARIYPYFRFNLVTKFFH